MAPVSNRWGWIALTVLICLAAAGYGAWKSLLP